MTKSYTLLDQTAPGWPVAIDSLWARLGAPHNPWLLPDHFVKTTFGKMGGRLLLIQRGGGALLGAGLLFPYTIRDEKRFFTLRLQLLGQEPDVDEMVAAVEQLIAPDRLRLYSPEDGQSFVPGHSALSGFDIGAPAADELDSIVALYSAIWGSGGSGYPIDLFSAEFAAGTALVARREGRPAGFLLGFYRFGLPALEESGLPYRFDLAIESQVMGVAPGFRRFGLAAALKRAQAHTALAQGIDLIHWTADPLQYPNAVLNFGKLRAVSGEYYPAFYPFRNALNRVSASRLGISWLPASWWGRAGLVEPGGDRARDLSRYPDCVILNDGPRQLRDADGAPFFAFEIPSDWTAMQHNNPELAIAWRACSDSSLGVYLGYTPDRYVIVDAASANERRYLVARRFTTDVLAR